MKSQFLPKLRAVLGAILILLVYAFISSTFANHPRTGIRYFVATILFLSLLTFLLVFKFARTERLFFALFLGGFPILVVFAPWPDFLGNLVGNQTQLSHKISVAAVGALMGPMDDYYADQGRYPAAKSIEELRSQLIPKYATSERLRDLEAVDGWGRPWHLVINRYDYLVESLDADNRRDFPQPAKWEPSTENGIIVHNGDWIRFPMGIASQYAGTGHATTGERSNSLIVFTGCMGNLQLLRGDRVVALDSADFEVPPGTYTLRTILNSGQVYDVPGTFTVQRDRIIWRQVIIPAGTVKFTSSKPPYPTLPPCEIWSDGRLVTTMDPADPRGWLREQFQLLAGKYVVKIRAPKRVIEKEFVVRTGEDAKVSIDYPL